MNHSIKSDVFGSYKQKKKHFGGGAVPGSVVGAYSAPQIQYVDFRSIGKG